MQPDPEPIDGFGARLAIASDVAVVGAFLRNETYTQQGAVYVYRYHPLTETWDTEQKLLASDAVGVDQLGGSLAIDGDVIVAGAIKQLFCPIPEQQHLCEPGAAYVFRFDGNSWNEEQKLIPSDGEGNDQFGTAVDISGDTIVVGSPNHVVADLEFAGAAYVYHWNGAQWTETGKLTASDYTSGDHFGEALAVSGTTAIVGAPDADGNESRTGAAYVFAVAGDCNANGEIDACEILADPSLDINGNLVIDYCSDIPAVSHWGLAAASLLLLTAGSIVLRRRLWLA